MTREETKTALHIIAEMYDRFTVTSAKVDIWHQVLKDYPAAVINNAIAAYIRTDTKGFAPVPGQLIDLIVDLTVDEMSEGEANNLLSKALRNGIYGFEEEFEKLPPILQECVGSASELQRMAMMPPTELSVSKARFMRDFRTLKDRKRQDAKIPLPVLDVLRKNNLLEAK